MPTPALLSVEEITLRFGGLTALSDVTFSVDRGELFAIIGPNGAGKTSMFNVICGFVRPASGRLAFNGMPLRRHHAHDLARLGIARTLQGVGLFSGLTVLQNVIAGSTAVARAGFASSLLGLPRAAGDEASLRERAIVILEELGVGAFADRFPSGLPYAIQKRVALARALVIEPKLLLLDEPASGLSEAEMDDLGALLRRLRERMSVILVEHHMDLVMSVCDRLVVLDFGQVISTGSPDQVKTDPKVTAAYLGEDASTLEPDLFESVDAVEEADEGGGRARGQ